MRAVNRGGGGGINREWVGGADCVGINSRQVICMS